MYLISFYVPKKYLTKVKESMFQAGAGKYKNYERCAWQTEGQGQFCPLAKSKPFIGKKGKLTLVAEYKVEMICDAKHVKKVIEALKSSHPYEEPAYNIIDLHQAS